MFLLYFLFVGLPDFCPRKKGLIVTSNTKTAICRLKRGFEKTSLLEWRFNIINTSNSKFWDFTKQSDH